MGRGWGLCWGGFYIGVDVELNFEKLEGCIREGEGDIRFR